MLREIIDIYKKEYGYYGDVLNMLKEFDREHVDFQEYEKKLEEVDFILDRIKKLNERAEQLKSIYVVKHNIPDFTAEEIRNIESEEDFGDLKQIVDSLGNLILTVKKLQDSIITRISNETNIIKRMLIDIKVGKDPTKIYTKQSKNTESLYLNKKK